MPFESYMFLPSYWVRAKVWENLEDVISGDDDSFYYVGVFDWGTNSYSNIGLYISSFLKRLDVLF